MPIDLGHNWSSLDFASIASRVTLEAIHHPTLSAANVRLYAHRDDLIDPYLGGNKFYKLYGHLNHFFSDEGQYSCLATFGGAFSNHLYAVAAAGSRFQFKTVGIVRGERPAVLSPTLRDCQAMGMSLVFVSRADYRIKQAMDITKYTAIDLTHAYWVPEGGAGTRGLAGVSMLPSIIQQKAPGRVDAIYHACGTGTSLAGLIAGSKKTAIRSLQGVAVLKGQGYLETAVESALAATLVSGKGERHSVDWAIDHSAHFGGYAKRTSELLSFIEECEQVFNVSLDPVYTAKLFYGIFQSVKSGRWPSGSQLVAIHSGGIQGARPLIS